MRNAEQKYYSNMLTQVKGDIKYMESFKECYKQKYQKEKS